MIPRTANITVLAALLAATAVVAQTAPTPKLRFPKQYAARYGVLACTGQPYFRCDDASKTCLRGIDGGGFIGQVLAADGKTVLAHIWNNSGIVINHDTGQAIDAATGEHAEPFDLHDDNPPPMPGNCATPPPDAERLGQIMAVANRKTAAEPVWGNCGPRSSGRE